ncbi:hypothetical protein LTS15_008680 [Exophiala xenobiotica]|nr:hypothetical protein LTS15_008680 [Exophiala xenobiotica]
MSPYSSEDDLPSLSSIIAPRPLMATSTNGSVRRSPRKQTAPANVGPGSPQKRQRGVASPVKAISARPLVTSQSPRNGVNPSKTPSVENVIPSLPRVSSTTETRTTSSNRRSTASPQRSLKLTHVDSLLLPLKVMAMEEQSPKTTVSRLGRDVGISHNQHKGSKSIMSLMTDAARQTSYQYPQKKKQDSSYASRFVLKEARCNDDNESSTNEEDEDEDTDLSGFIVDDDAELSYHDSSPPESDVDDWRISARRMPRTAPRRRLQQGSRNKKRVESAGEEKKPAYGLVDALKGMRLNEGADEAKDGGIEVIDLTSSPVALPKPDLNMGHAIVSPQIPDVKTPSDLVNPLDVFEAPVKLDPPTTRPGLIVPSKSTMPASAASRPGSEEGQYTSTEEAEDGFKTPPATPPQSPSKLKSPSKLLSPSKRHFVPHSPHRQSMDAFWDHNVINEWNDEYSPKKAPATSPRKKGLARFQIWSDFEQDDDQDIGSSDSLPSPSTSPRKSRARSQSPMKSPEKEEKKRLAEEKRLALPRKKDFDSRKKQLAIDLVQELDVNVADSQLQRLACSTGGVRIIWSKTLRSTAGRASWKRTVTKMSGSPVKEGREVTGPGVKVEHFASIELAEKIVDCEDRLVNTVAHEFCHLTNFMISNVRDQPHGASFKQWAGRVTSHLRKSNVDMWRRVEVTTKHSYVINHKYLWVCAGREKTSAMAFLNIEEDEGCGAEYGRHSKSIDTEKHRCGKCKGRLVQVRPKPRGSPKKTLQRSPVKREGSAESVGSSSSTGSDATSTLGKLIELVELSD